MSDHKAKAEQNLAPLSEDEIDLMNEDRDVQMVVLAGAVRTQAHATLALVEQQRIANLIAYAMKLSVKTDLTDCVSSDINDFYAITRQIREGLDLA